jgi:iron complex outermembrane receptor protein
MFKSRISKGVSIALAFSAISGISTSVYAADANAEEGTFERIQVTGSRIKRIGAMAPTPITVISGADIQRAGITNVGELLNKLPSSTVGLSPETTNNTIFASGLNQTSLRGLGSDRTLVLVNGRRFVSGSSGGSAVDLNSIPTAIVDRIEVITGGASAVYGSDAIAGVVNVITRKSTDGVELDASFIMPDQSGGEKKQFSLTYGSDFDNDKGSMIFNVTQNEDKQLRVADRDFTSTPVYGIYNPEDTGVDDGIPQRYKWEGNRKLNWLNYDGVFSGGPEGRYTFGENGSLKAFNFGDGPVSSHPREGNYCTGEICDGYQSTDTGVISTPVERTVFTFSSTYNLTDSHRFITEFTHANSQANGDSSPVFHRGTEISIDNPFIKDDLRNLMTDEGMDEIGLYRLSTEFGNRKYFQDRTTLRYVFGLEGELTDTWGYSTYYQKGELKDSTNWTGQIINDRWTQALDAVRDADGNIVCRDDSNGCQPLNILGRNMASQEAIDWVGTEAGRSSTTTQEVYSVLVDGVAFELPAGDVAVAIGAEYREEFSETNPDMALRNGLIFGNKSAAMKGEYDVAEYSIETNIPLVSDVFLAKNLSLDLAYRYMDYSTAGNHDAWKVGLNWDIVDDVKFRATRSNSVRAPNIGELFAPRGQTFETITDVCRLSDINQGPNPAQREANCRAAGIPVGWSPSASWDQGNRPGYNKGNADLTPETSEDYTLGFVYTPSFIENFSITVDYWSFDIEDSINSLAVQTAVKYCYDSISTDNVFCQQFTRDASNDIDWFVQQSVNMASYQTSGYDIETDYVFEAGEWGSFHVNLISTYLEEYEFNSTGFASDIDVDVGEYTNPRFKARLAISWDYEDLSVQMLGKYIHSSVTDRTRTDEDYDYVNIPSSTTWDLTGSYTVMQNLDVRFGILNLFDKAPPRNPVVYDGAGYYDTLGRAPFVGVNYKF